MSRFCNDSARDQQDVLDTSNNLEEVHLFRLSKYQVSLLLLHLNQVSSDAIADQKLQLAALNALIITKNY